MIHVSNLDWNLERANKKLLEIQKNYSHEWENYIENLPVINRICFFCRCKPPHWVRTYCTKCELLVCLVSAQLKFNLEISPSRKPMTSPQADHRLLIQQQSRHNLDLKIEIIFLKASIVDL